MMLLVIVAETWSKRGLLGCGVLVTAGGPCGPFVTERKLV